MYRQSSKQSSSANIMITYHSVILESKRFESLFSENITCQFSDTILKPMSKDVISVRLPKRSDISLTLPFNRSPTHWQKDLLMDFITRLPILTDQKGDSYNSILVIINRLIKMIYYQPVQLTINTHRLAQVILDVLAQHHSFPDLIESNRDSVLTSNFQFSLCYFLGLRQ